MTDTPPVKTPRSALHRLIDTKLGRPSLDEYLLEARRLGQGFNQIAYELHNKTGVALTHEAVRRWVRALEEERSIPPSALPGHEHHSMSTLDQPAA